MFLAQLIELLRSKNIITAVAIAAAESVDASSNLSPAGFIGDADTLGVVDRGQMGGRPSSLSPQDPERLEASASVHFRALASYCLDMFDLAYWGMTPLARARKAAF